MDTNLIRIAKKIAESGIASRREAERMIEQGRVTVNGELITSPVFFVDESHLIEVDGNRLPTSSKQICVWKMNKPCGYITTRFDPQGRKTVFDLFPKNISDRILYVGRLDINSEGLLLFTNDGNLSRKLELPSTGLERTYKVRFFGKLSEDSIQKIKRGVVIDGIRYSGADIKVQPSKSGSNNWATMTIKEGKNREVRKILEHFGCSVNKLIRLSYGSIKLGDLPLGKIQQVSESELRQLLSVAKVI